MEASCQCTIPQAKQTKVTNQGKTDIKKKQNRLWLDRNPTTPCHAFVGDAPGLLPKIQAAAERDPHSALVLVCPLPSTLSPSSAEDPATLAVRLDGLGVAVLTGSVVRVDPQACLLLTRDERVLLFDSLTVQWGRRDHAGVEAAAMAAGPQTEDEEGPQHPVRRGEIVRPEWKLVPASASAAAAASAAMQQGGKGSAAASGCNRGCSSIVRRKSLHATGEGLHNILDTWRLSQTDTWPWCVRSVASGGGTGRGKVRGGEIDGPVDRHDTHPPTTSMHAQGSGSRGTRTGLGCTWW